MTDKSSYVIDPDFNVGIFPIEEFEAKYETVKNGDSDLWETYGEELEKVLRVANSDPNRIWTVIDCDGRLFLSQGYHLVNRINYVITTTPCPPEEEGRDYNWDGATVGYVCRKCEGTFTDTDDISTCPEEEGICHYCLSDLEDEDEPQDSTDEQDEKNTAIIKELTQMRRDDEDARS